MQGEQENGPKTKDLWQSLAVGEESLPTGSRDQPQSPLGSRDCECRFELYQTFHETWGPDERLESVWQKTEEAVLQVMIADCVPRL